MLSTQPSGSQSTPTTCASPRSGTLTARVALEVALVAELVVDVPVSADADDASAAARSAALESRARLEWDAISLACARALRTVLVERGDPLVVGLRVIRMAAGESPELLVRNGEVG